MKFNLINLMSAECQSSDLVGSKAHHLAKLARMKKIATKSGYVLPSDVYEIYIKPKIESQMAEINALQRAAVQDKSQIESLLEEIRTIILNFDLSEISKQLDVLDSSQHYAVRSSATAEDGNQASFSGKFATFLFVKKADVATRILLVYQSMFSLNNLEYCQANDLDFSALSMAVVIQEMSCSLAAGTVFTDAKKTEIDVAFGLEAVVRGDVPTDKVMVDSKTGHVIFTEISKKKTELVYSERAGQLMARPLLPRSSQSLSVTPEQIQQLHEQMAWLKDAFPECERGLDVEFSCDANGEIYILQVRPVTVAAPEDCSQVDAQKCQSHFIGQGDAVSHYVATGLLAICHTPEEAEKAIEKAALERVDGETQKVILVTANTTSQWESVMRRSAGIIAEVGSTNSHTAIACREMYIAGITGYEEALQHLQPYAGLQVTVCGVSGKVYRGDQTAADKLSTGKPRTYYTPKETEETFSAGKHLAMAAKAGMIVQYQDQAYIGKPVTPTCQLINALDRAAHQCMENALGLSPATYHISADHVLLMKFDDCHRWRKQIRDWTVARHQEVLTLRRAAEEEFLQASHGLQLSERALQRWFDAYQQKIGFDNVAFAIGEILNGVLHQAAQESGLAEPILSDLIPAEIARMGHFELEKCHAEIRQIQSGIAQNPKIADLLKRLEAMYSQAEESDDLVIAATENDLINQLKELGLYQQWHDVVTGYRIRDKDFSLTFLEPWFQKSRAPWLRLLIESKKLTNPAPQPLSNRKKIYYPNHAELRSIIELVASSKKCHMDGHHTKARGLWQFIAVMQKLSYAAGYSIASLLSMASEEIIKMIRVINSMTQPGTEPRALTAEQQSKFKALEDSRLPLNQEQIAKISLFCDHLPTESYLEHHGYQNSEQRIIFPAMNTGLAAELEMHEQRVSDSPDALPAHMGRIENKRPSLQDTQHQVAVEGLRVVTMVALSENKTSLTLPTIPRLGKTVNYTAPYKWRNSAFLLGPAVPIDSDHYDKIFCYSDIIDQYFIPNFADCGIAEKLSKLLEFHAPNISEREPALFDITLISNTRTNQISLENLIKELVFELEAEQHILAMIDKEAPDVIRGRDGYVPKMQSVVRIPARHQQMTFIETIILELNHWRTSSGDEPVNESWLFDEANASWISAYLQTSGVTPAAQVQFWNAHRDARNFREYARKPKLCVENEDGTVVEISMNDSIDIPSQALMMIATDESTIETNRPVNLLLGYQALVHLTQNKFSGQMQDVIFSQLAYTQASSTQSMSHFHVVPVYNSEGQFMIPFLEGQEEAFEAWGATDIVDVSVSYLKDEVQKNSYNLLKFRIVLSANESSNARMMQALDQKLQYWEMQTGCDMTWVAKFNPLEKTMTLCVELRAGINQFSHQQINELRDRNVWDKIGFTEVMGKKYSMLSQSHLDKAAEIYQNEPVLAAKLLTKPLYCLQVSPDGQKTYYQFQDSTIGTTRIAEPSTLDIVHIARILQLYDAEVFTHAMAALYHLQADELNAFKDLFCAALDVTEDCAGTQLVSPHGIQAGFFGSAPTTAPLIVGAIDERNSASVSSSRVL